MTTPAETMVPLRGAPRVRADFRRRLQEWFLAEGRDLPWRRTEDAYAIFVSEVMLQQTQVVTVIPYFQRWMQRFPDVQALADAAEPEVLELWQGLGYYARARNLHRAARWVVREHAGEMPREVAALQGLPGAGPYTVGAIASFAYDVPAAAVDANIARVLARLFEVREPIDTTAGRRALWQAAELLLPPAGGRLHNSALMELGALVCIPRQPRCGECPVRSVCAAREPDLLPVKSPRRATVALGEDCAWILEDGRLLLEQQRGSRWAGLWKLPRAAVPGNQGPLLWEAIYPFTHHRVTLRVRREAVRALRADEAWFSQAAWTTAALPSPHRRAVEALWPGAPNL